jgi:hypothetical protein
MASKTAHAQLAELREQAAAEAGRARDAGLRLQAAQAKRAEAHAELVRAHDEGADAKTVEKAKRAIRQADEDQEFLAAEVEGLANRAKRAQQAITNFEVTENERLLAELEPEAIKVRDDLAAAFGQIPEALAAYNAVVEPATRLVSVTGKSPQQEGPHGHGLDQLAHTIKQQTTGKEIRVPLPDWRYTKWLAEQARQQAERERAAA